MLRDCVIAATVLWVVFGALLLLNLLENNGSFLLNPPWFCRSISGDHRIQLLFVGWLLVAFLEGAAGFGTPAAIAAPLLIALGFRPLAAVVLTSDRRFSASLFWCYRYSSTGRADQRIAGRIARAD